MVVPALLTLILPLICLIESNARTRAEEIRERSLPNHSGLSTGDGSSTKIQFSMFFSPATKIVPRAWKQERRGRRKRKSYQAPVSAHYTQLSPDDTNRENLTSFDIETKNDTETTSSRAEKTVTKSSIHEDNVNVDLPSEDDGSGDVDLLSEGKGVVDLPSEGKGSANLLTTEIRLNTTPTQIGTSSKSTTTPATEPKTFISRETTSTAPVISTTTTSTPSSPDSATKVTLPLQIPTSLVAAKDGESVSDRTEQMPGETELFKQTVRPSTTELVEIGTETEEANTMKEDWSGDQCYTHTILLLGLCVVMCDQDLLRFCG